MARVKVKHAALALAAAAALGAAEPAVAAPPLLAAIATVAATAAGIASTVFLGLTVTQWIFVGTLAYGAYKGHEARKDARRAYNRSLTDRNVSLSGGEVPWQIIYGEAPVAPAFAAILTSGDKDEFKHVVTVWAAHESEACTDALLGGESIGPLDVDGWVTTGKWAKVDTETLSANVTLDGSGTATLPHVPVQVFEAQYNLGSDNGFEYATPTVDGDEITIAGWAGRLVTVSYTRATSRTRVRVRHFTGSVDQVADPVLMALLPANWTASDRLRGLTYSIWTFDLREPELQSMPRMSARWKGKKLYDYRTGLTAWSANNALCTADFLRAEYGKRCTAAQINTAGAIASANACDEALAEFDDAPRYTCNGAFRTDVDPDETLRLLLQSMAGSATFGGTWRINAGVYTAPVMDLDDADNAGAVEEIPAPSGLEVFNGLRGKFFDPEKYDVLTDYPPYSNAAFVAEDNGEKLWGDLALPFTNEAWRAHNIARIIVERSRGEQITYPAKRRTVKLRPGQRIRLSNSYLQMTNTIFRLVRHEWQPGQAQVMLHLQRDDPSYWDTVDAPASLPPPADNNPDPFVVAPVEGLVVESGDAVALRATDGTVLSRVRVTVDASEDALVTSNGALQIEYRLPEETSWTRAPEAPGSVSQAWVQGMQDGRLYLVQVRWRNGLGAYSDWRSDSVLTAGDQTSPDLVQGFAVAELPGGLVFGWSRAPEADYAATVLQLHEDGDEETPWDDDMVPWYQGDATQRLMPWPADGVYAVLAKHKDHSGNLSSEPVRLLIEIDGQHIVSITRTWIQGTGEGATWMSSILDPENGEILGYEPAAWDGTGGGLLIDTPQIEDEAATVVTVDEDESATASWTRPGVGFDTVYRVVLRQISWLNDTGAPVRVALTGQFRASRTSGAGSVYLVIASGTAASTTDALTDDGGVLTGATPNAAGGEVSVLKTRTFSLAAGQTAYLAALVYITTASSSTTEAAAADIDLRIEAFLK